MIQIIEALAAKDAKPGFCYIFIKTPAVLRRGRERRKGHASHRCGRPATLPPGRKNGLRLRRNTLAASTETCAARGKTVAAAFCGGSGGPARERSKKTGFRRARRRGGRAAAGWCKRRCGRRRLPTNEAPVCRYRLTTHGRRWRGGKTALRRAGKRHERLAQSFGRFVSSQKATAAAAATLSESTWCAIGIFTV